MGKRIIRIFSDESKVPDGATVVVEKQITRFLDKNDAYAVVDACPTESVSPDQDGALWHRYTVLLVLDDCTIAKEETPQQDGIDAALEAVRRHTENMTTERNHAMSQDSKIAFGGAISTLKELYKIIEKLKQ